MRTCRRRFVGTQFPYLISPLSHLAMNIETIPLSDLKPAPYNPRVALKPGMPGYDKLARSLSEFELVQPLVWNRLTGHVVGGHQRLAILAANGATDAPCVVVDLSDEREKALNIALNNDNVGGDWKPDKLLELLGELQTLPEFDIAATGFDEDDLREMLLDPATDTSAMDAEDESEFIDVTLEVPRDRWTDVETWVDALLAGEPTVRVHVAV